MHKLEKEQVLSAVQSSVVLQVDVRQKKHRLRIRSDVMEGLDHSEFASERIAATTQELGSEREAVSDLLLGPI